MRSLPREKSKGTVKCEKVNRYFIEKNNSMYYSKCWDRDNLLAGKKLEAVVTRNPFLIEGARGNHSVLVIWQEKMAE